MPSRAISRAHDEDCLRLHFNAAKSGDHEALQAMLQIIGPTIVSTVRRILGNQNSEIEDIAQQAMIGFVQALARFRSECSIKSFANRIAVLTALKARRFLAKRDRLVFYDTFNVEELEINTRSQSICSISQGQLRQVLATSLAILPETIQQIP
ncbi:MAG: sigma-70 family RNA polymerase sigma factor [Deltaproteobacteria bacterium]|nr:sigma-70 family RNA polymerase sigma factor [Deltaproteobacteria bacterium]